MAPRPEAMLNIQPGWEGLVYGVLIAAGVVFVGSAFAVGFGVRAVIRIVRPQTTVGLLTCVPLGALLLLVCALGYISVKHAQHRGRSVNPPDEPATVDMTNPALRELTPDVVAVHDGPGDSIALVLRVPAAGTPPCTVSVSGFGSFLADVNEITVQPLVQVPESLADPFETCGTVGYRQLVGGIRPSTGTRLILGTTFYFRDSQGVWTASPS
jgi:hypothetical protein